MSVLKVGAAMKRREFITLVGGAAASWPFAARAQQPAMPVMGFINAASPEPYAPMLSALLKGLGETGFVENKNLRIEYRWGQGQIDRLPALAADLVRREVAVIAATGTPAAIAAKAATATIPIVFEMGNDPVQLGLVASLNRPGGNITGVAQLATEVAPKRLELLHEMVPKARIVALLADPTDRAIFENTTRGVQAAARSLGLEIHVLSVSNDSDFDAAFPKLVELHAGGLVISGGQFFNSRSKQIATAALRYAVPTISPYVDLAAANGLMSYGTSITDAYRLAGVYTGRILKGEKPADLPVQQATKVELVINLRAARALGITVPTSLVGRADAIIE
ncbi:MAG TPA: ABC transporter substrate-binding protein [Pseudolabrys sp.]|jgi:putative ABC transport system substrate-binding protein|nr:ABC transporter substrate-binding protein [Pseudolabrys sp.]